MRWLGLILILTVTIILVTKSEEEGGLLAALNPFDNASTSPQSTDGSFSDRFFGSSKEDINETPSSVSSKKTEEKVTKVLEDLNKLEEDSGTDLRVGCRCALGDHRVPCKDSPIESSADTQSRVQGLFEDNAPDQRHRTPRQVLSVHPNRGGKV